MLNCKYTENKRQVADTVWQLVKVISTFSFAQQSHIYICTEVTTETSFSRVKVPLQVKISTGKPYQNVFDYKSTGALIEVRLLCWNFMTKKRLANCASLQPKQTEDQTGL